MQQVQSVSIARNESVSAGCSEPFAVLYGRLPDGRVRIIGEDDVEESITLPRLPGGLALFDLSVETATQSGHRQRR